MKYYKDLFITLVRAQEQRNSRDDWQEFERKTMHDAVNEIRGELGKPPVLMIDIRKAETTTMGHIDYTSKFALYCAELASSGSFEKKSLTSESVKGTLCILRQRSVGR